MNRSYFRHHQYFVRLVSIVCSFLIVSYVLAGYSNSNAMADDALADIEAFIRQLEAEAAKDVVDEVKRTPREEDTDGGVYKKKIDAVKIVRKATDFSVINPVADVTWPGSLIQGKSLTGNQLAPIPLSRTPGTIVIATSLVPGPNAQNPNTFSERVEAPSLNKMNAAIRTVLNKLGPQDAAGFTSFFMSDARTFEHGFVNLGININSKSAALNLKAALDNDQSTCSVIVKFVQGFYKVVFEPSADERGKSPFFSNNVTLRDLKNYSGQGNTPVYISDVTYGRLLLLCVTSRASRHEVKAALSAHCDITARADVNLNAGLKKTMNDSTIQVLNVGDTGQLGATVLKPTGKDESLSDALIKYLRAGAKFNFKNNPGAPIAYTARYLGNRTLAAAALTTDFDEVVDWKAPNVSREIEIWDGKDGGPRSTDVRVFDGDKLEITARGRIWSGIFLAGDHGPDGYAANDTNGKYPIEKENRYCVIGGYNSAGWFKVGSSYEGTAKLSEPKTLWFSINDDIPDNGDPNKKFVVRYTIKRKERNLVGVGKTD